MKKITYSLRYLSKVRTRRIYRRRWKESKNRRHTVSLEHHQFETGGYKSAIIDFVNQYGRQPTLSKRTNVRLKLPSSFSLITHPEDSLLEINRLALAFRSPMLRSVRVDCRDVEYVDLGAVSVFHYLVKEFEIESRRQHKMVRVSPMRSDLGNIELYMSRIGLFPDKKKPLDGSNKAQARVMRMTSSKEHAPDSYQKNTRHERASADLIDYVDECLSIQNRVLTKAGKRQLAIYAGEILNNATEHSGQDSWCITGLLSFVDGMYVCEVCIFNFGISIAESFKGLSAESKAWREIAPYIEAHKRKNRFSGSWTETSLVTLAALQGHVSSKLDSDEDRGQGSVHLIEFFQRIHNECNSDSPYKAEMALLSGSVYIYFDGTYMMKEDSFGRKVIAFNKENNLNNPPDQKYVRVLNGEEFPGTAIAIRFPLQASQIEEADK